MPSCTAPTATRLLNLYADGELSSARQADLFAHLAACPACRTEFNALLAFRLTARQEALTVPPAADEAFFARIDRLRRAAPSVQGAAERRRFGAPLRRRVPLGAALAVAALVLAATGLLGQPAEPVAPAEARPYRLTEVVTEDGNALYVMDAVTVEGDRRDRRRPPADG